MGRVVISKGPPDQMEGLLSGFQNCPFCVEEGRDMVLLQRAGNKCVWGGWLEGPEGERRVKEKHQGSWAADCLTAKCIVLLFV